MMREGEQKFWERDLGQACQFRYHETLLRMTILKMEGERGSPVHDSVQADHRRLDERRKKQVGDDEG